jgi:hypothetical protein
MFGIPKVYLILAAVLAAITIYFTGHHKGWVERDLEMQVEIAKRNEESREIERNMTSKLNQNATKLEEANNVLAEKSTALDRAIRAGRLRLPSSSCVPASPGSSPTSADRNDEASESDRQTLAAIAAIVAEGDRNTLQLNACITAYNEMREQINGKQ